jgi:hypothetical protein
MKLKTLLMLVAVTIAWYMAPAYADETMLPINLGNGISASIPFLYDNVDAWTNIVNGSAEAGVSTTFMAYKGFTLGAGGVISDNDKGAIYSRIGYDLVTLNLPFLDGTKDIKFTAIGSYNADNGKYGAGICASKGFVIRIKGLNY